MVIYANYIVKNEQHFLPISIESIYEYVDHIVVIDDCSTDKTIETLKPFENKITLKHVIPDSTKLRFSTLRNMALAQSSYADFILPVDADSIFFDTFMRRLREYARKMVEQNKTILRGHFYHMLENLDYVHNINSNIDPRYARVLMFANIPGIYWEGDVHEGLKNIPENIWTISSFTDMHLGYTRKQPEIYNKIRSYLEAEGQKIEDVHPGLGPNNILDDRPRFNYSGGYEHEYYPYALESYLRKTGGILKWQL